MKRILFAGLGLITVLFAVSCSTPKQVVAQKPAAQQSSGIPTLASKGKLEVPRDGKLVVRTTAYTHTEADSLQYGRKTALGTYLKYGNVRSAAADWSRFPVGTLFRIQGHSHLYQIDDYGSALVGTNTIDLYKPTKSSMNHWGVRYVPIQIVKWGSYARSLEVMKERTRAKHVRAMVSAIRARGARG